MTDKKQDEKSFDSSKINTQELQKYKQDYSEYSFKEKLPEICQNNWCRGSL